MSDPDAEVWEFLDGPVNNEPERNHAVLPFTNELLPHWPEFAAYIDRQTRFLQGRETEEDRRQEAADALAGAQLIEKCRVDRIAKRTDSLWQPLTLDALLSRLNIGPRFAAHLVQLYCACYESGECGWVRCAHAIDLGIEESS